MSACNSQYRVNGLPFENLLIKVTIWEIQIDTNTNTTSIRTQPSSLDAYIGTIGCYITKFNAHVKLLLAGLSSRRETRNDLLTHLFKGYKAASYSFLGRYIERNRYTYESGQDLTPTDLTLLAENKFKILKLKEEWNAPLQE